MTETGIMPMNIISFMGRYYVVQPGLEIKLKSDYCNRVSWLFSFEYFGHILSRSETEDCWLIKGLE